MILKDLKKIPISSEFCIFKVIGDREHTIQGNNYNMQLYNISNVSENFEKTDINDIYSEINNFDYNSENMMICRMKKIQKCQFYVFYYNNKLIIINQSNIVKLKPFLAKVFYRNNLFENSELPNFFFFSTKQKDHIINDLSSIGIKINLNFGIFDDKMKLQISQFNEKYSSYIQNPLKSIWKLIYKNINGYIIKSSYYSTFKERMACKSLISKAQNFENFFNSKNFITIEKIRQNVSLKCNIKDQKICIVKKSKENKREELFYKTFEYQHPFISKYLGEYKDGDNSFICIEYIEGKTLNLISSMNLSFVEKIKIIGEIMLSIEFIHSKNVFLRDLKPDNVMIDSKHDAILIDFDLSKIDSETENTGDFGNDDFMSPEQFKSNDYSYKSDIYSLGMHIYFIIMEKISSDEMSDQFLFLKPIFENCVNKLADERPNISTIITDFIFKIDDSIKNDTIKENKAEIKEVLRFLIDYRFQFMRIITNSMNDSYVDLSEIYYFFGDIFLKGEYMAKDIVQSIKFYEYSSNVNNKKAQFALGIIYYKGIGVPINQNEGIKYLQLAADKNHIQAQSALGTHYCKIDKNKAIKYLTLAADQNDVTAQFNLANIYYLRNDIDKALYYFKLAADQNDYDAQYYLGEIYLKRLNSKEDVWRAIDYLKQSADHGNSNAQLLLGLYYFDESYIQREMNKALHYFELSANQNNMTALFHLGTIYMKGLGVSQNLIKAIDYFSRCVDIKEALFFIGLIYSNFDIKKAIYYFKQSSDLAESQFNLGIIYSDKSYGIFDINQAIHYFTLAEKQNHSNAQYNLGLIYANGVNVTRDVIKAIYYLEKAVKNKNILAQLLLGIIYFQKEYNHYDIDKALHYFQSAADNGNSEAQFHLGLIYQMAECGRQNIQKSIHYYEQAATQGHSRAQFNLALIYESDKYNLKDLSKTIHYLKLSADKNFVSAQYQLGLYYCNEFNNKQFFDMKKAIFYLTLATNKGHSKAQLFLGFFYYEGRYIPRDINKAIHYYKEASSLNNYQAKNNLGVLYKNGEYGIKKNIFLAIEYFEEANKLNIMENSQNEIEFFSFYNLAKIYYFGNDTNKNVDKSISILLRASEMDSIYADVFLFFIYSCDENVQNHNQAFHYFSKIKQKQKNKFVFNIQSRNILEGLFFIEHCDLVFNPNDPVPHDFMNFFFDVEYPDYIKKANKQNVKYKYIREINHLFYEGFEN